MNKEASQITNDDANPSRDKNNSDSVVLGFYDEIIYDCPISLSTNGIAERLGLNLDKLKNPKVIPQGSVLPWGILFLFSLQNLRANATRSINEIGEHKVTWNSYYMLGDTQEERVSNEKTILDENFKAVKYLFDKLSIEQKTVVAEMFVEQVCSDIYGNELLKDLLKNKHQSVGQENQLMWRKKLAMQLGAVPLQIQDNHKPEREVGVSNRYIYKVMEMFNQDGVLDFLSVPSLKSMVMEQGLVKTFASLREIRELLKTFESGDKFNPLFDDLDNVRNDFWKMVTDGIAGNVSNDLKMGLIESNDKTYTIFHKSLTCYINSLIDDSYAGKSHNVEQLKESLQVLEKYVFDELGSSLAPCSMIMVKNVLGVLYDLSLSDELSRFLLNQGGVGVSLRRDGLFENLLLIDVNENEDYPEQMVMEKTENNFNNPSSMIVNLEVLLNMDRINDYDIKKSFVDVIDGNSFRKQAFMMKILSMDIGSLFETYRKAQFNLFGELGKETIDTKKAQEFEKTMENVRRKLIGSKVLFLIRKSSLNLISSFCKETNTPFMLEIGQYKNNAGVEIFGMKVMVNDMSVDFLKHMLKTFLFDYEKPVYEMEIEINDLVMRQDLSKLSSVENTEMDKNSNVLLSKTRKF